MASVGFYAANGSWNVTVVTGSSAVGLYAADGSINVFKQTGTSAALGMYHPSGALNVAVAPATLVPIRAPDGSLYVCDATSSGASGILLNHGQPVTVISGNLFGSSFTGPGDIVASATAWWGVRAYSNAKKGTNAIRLRRDSDQAESDFITLVSTGALDVASIATFKTAAGAANLFVTKWYDQTGNLNHLTQAAAGLQAPFTLAGFGAFPIVGFSGASFNYGGGPAITIPITVSWVANNTLIINNDMYGGGGAGIFIQYNNNLNTNEVRLFAGAALAATASDGAWHAIQGVFNGASSDVNVDGARTTGSTGATASDTATGLPLPGNSWTGSIVELGQWPTNFTSPQETSMNSNQHTYYGF